MSDSDQAAADQDAAARREADLKAAADSLAAQRKAEDEATAQRRLAEDEALADARTEQDRVVASARNQLSVAAVALSAAVAAVPADAPGAADLRAANGGLQAAIQDHLDAVPEPPPAAPAGE